jgi:hypothetical protein
LRSHQGFRAASVGEQEQDVVANISDAGAREPRGNELVEDVATSGCRAQRPAAAGGRPMPLPALRTKIEAWIRGGRSGSA